MISDKMYMDRNRANQRIDSLLEVHIKALSVNPETKRVAEALENAKPDFKNLIKSIYDEIEDLERQHKINVEAGVERPE